MQESKHKTMFDKLSGSENKSVINVINYVYSAQKRDVDPQKQP